jgi:hypothetical protein
MLHLSALALGPLLARAAPKISSGVVDNATTISHWLTERFSDPGGKLAKVLTRVADRAWLSLEIALAGAELHRCAIDSGVDRALVEQIRQFISVAALPTASLEPRQRVRGVIQNARESEKIPGPVPTADALAALIIRYLGASDESPEIDLNLLIELSLELRIAGYSELGGFVQEKSADQHPLLLTAARYFLSREIAEDPKLLRDLRYTRIELLSDAVRTGYDRLADAVDRFTPVLIDLLSNLTSSSDPDVEPTAVPASDPSKIAEPGFFILGEHLISPIRTDTDGSRVAPCPVCMSNAVLPSAALAWVSLRCASCGTEFQATDGTAPPPSPPPVPRFETTDKPSQKTLLAKNLQLWIDSGGPLRWIEYYKGVWNESEFDKLTHILRISRFWPLEISDVRKVLMQMIDQYFTRHTVWGRTPPGASESASASTARGLVRTSEDYPTIDGSRWVPCPLCRSFNVKIPLYSSGEVILTCSGCRRSFLAVLKNKSTAAAPHAPLPTTPSLWGKIRKWFGG